MTMSLREYLWQNRWRFTQKEFADRLKITPTYLSHVANGGVIPSMALAKKIELETAGAIKWHELMDYCSTMLEAKKEKIK